jgi:hypothetical protein
MRDGAPPGEISNPLLTPIYEYTTANDADRKAILSLSSDPATSFVGPLGMKHAFLDWGNSHPERLKLPMATGVIEALREKWPCSLR